MYAADDPINKWDPLGQETLIETATTLAIDGILNTLRFARPLLNVIGTAGQRALGNALLERFALRFSARLGEKAVFRILVQSGIGRDAATRMVAESFGRTIAKKGFEQIVTGTVKKPKVLLSIVFFLFLGDKARADENARDLTPVDRDDALVTSAMVVFMDDERPFISPRLARVFDELYHLMLPFAVF